MTAAMSDDDKELAIFPAARGGDVVVEWRRREGEREREREREKREKEREREVG